MCVLFAYNFLIRVTEIVPHYCLKTSFQFYDYFEKLIWKISYLQMIDNILLKQFLIESSFYWLDGCILLFPALLFRL